MKLQIEQRPIKETASFIVGGKLPANISEDIFEQLADAIDQDNNILSVPATALADSFYAGLALIVLNPAGATIGFTRLTPLYRSGDESWYELGSTWVHEDYRNQGLITVSYRKLLAQNEDKNILAATMNKAAIAVGKKLDFVIVARKDLPAPVWQACCVCPRERTGVDNNQVCERAYDEVQQTGINCYTRVTQATVDRFKLNILQPIL